MRVLVEPSEVDDAGALALSRDIARKIESELAYPGQVKLRWQRVPGAIMYVVERSTSAYDQPEQWERVDETSRPQYTLQNMEPHAPLRFRVRALGTKVKGPYIAIAHGVAA